MARRSAFGSVLSPTLWERGTEPPPCGRGRGCGSVRAQAHIPAAALHGRTSNTIFGDELVHGHQAGSDLDQITHFSVTTDLRNRHRILQFRGINADKKLRFSNGPGDVKSPGAADSRFSKCRRSWLVPFAREILSNGKRFNICSHVSPAGYLLLSVVSAKAASMMPVRKGSGEQNL